MRADWHAGDHPEQFGRTLRTRSAQAKAADRMLCKMPLFQNTENCVLPSVSVNLTVAAAVEDFRLFCTFVGFQCEVNSLSKNTYNCPDHNFHGLHCPVL